MAVLTQHITGQDTDTAIGDVAGTENRRAQGFQISANAIITSVELYLKDGTGPPTDDITIRIETNTGGVPSGNLAHANATGTINDTDIGGSYAFETCTFASSFSLLANTTYHIVASVPNQANDIFFLWGADSAEGYPNGVLSTSQNGGAWANNALDGLFIVNGTLFGGANIAFEI